MISTLTRDPRGRFLAGSVTLALTIGVGPACSSDAVPAADGATPSAAQQAVADFTCPATATEAGEERDGPAGEQLRIVTTVSPITSIVANVVGDAAEVRGVVPEGTNSHTFEPLPSMAADLADADLVIANGLQLEDPTIALAEANVGEGAQIVELGTLTITPDQYLYDFSFPESGGKPNPHLWTNPPMARCYAEAVASVVAKADPANAATYRANAAAYAAKVDELDRLVVEATETVPPADRTLLTYHDAYAYFAARYGWEVLGAVQVSDFEDPSPREVVSLIEQVRDAGLPAVFGSEVFPSAVLERIADEAGATYVDELRDDDLPGAPGDPDHTFLALLQANVVTMVQALGGDPSGLVGFDPSDVTVDRAEYPQ